jgi:hypothetical protein
MMSRALAAERGPGAVVVRCPADGAGGAARLLLKGVRLRREEAGPLVFERASQRGLGGHDEDIVNPFIHVGFRVRSYWIPGSYAPTWSEKRHSF